MKFTFLCANCSMELETEAAMVGSQVECPGCKSVQIAPRKEIGPGTTIGGFRVQKLLGRGGMGEVWLASQLSLERDVALKVLPPQMGMSPVAAQRFIHEVRMLARLSHPNIVPAWEAGEDDGILFFAMAFVPGESLEAHLQRDGAVPEAWSLRLAAKVGGALAYAWNQHQLLHRDVKPSNILLDGKGDPHLVDLGLAKSLAGSVNLTMSGGVMGTPNYMSPEQARGDGQIDCRADIYSLGMTLYHMVTGQVPFESPSPMETMRKQIMEPLPDPREFNASISDPCVTLLETMLAKAPSGRHDTWEALLEDLRLVLGGDHPSRVLGAGGGSVLTVRKKGGRTISPAPAAPAAPRKQGAKPSKKHLVPVIAGVAVVLAALAASGFWMLAGKRTQTAQPTPSPTTTAVAKPAPATTHDVAKGSSTEPPSYYQEALEYARRHPKDFDGALSRFEKAQKAATDPALAIKATEEIAQVKAEKARAIEQAVASLKAEAEQALKEGRFEEAVKKLEDATGPFAEETVAARAELVAKLKEQQAATIQAKQAAAQAAAAAKEQEAEARRREALQARMGSLLVGAASDVIRQDLAGASKRVSAAIADPELSALANELAEAQASVAHLVALPDAVLAGFEREKGQETSVEFTNGQKLKLTIVAVNAGKVSARQALGTQGFADRSFSAADLAAAEKYRRLGSETTPEAQLMRGFLACTAQNWGLAEKEWSQAGTRFAGILADQARQRTGLPTGKPMETAAAKVGDPGPVAHPPDAKPSEERNVSSNLPPRTSPPAPSTASSPPPVALKAATEENVKQALATLKSQLDTPGKYTLGEEGIVLDLSNNARLQNLLPLAGLPIIDLNLGKTAVKDLSPLVGMPLISLSVFSTQVHDLRPLGRITTLEQLKAGLTHITDLSPLRGLRNLKSLSVNQCQIKDLAPIESLLALDTLDLTGVPVTNLSPLQKLPHLQDLRLIDCEKLRDISPLKSESLKNLSLTGAGVDNVAPLRGLSLARLSIGNMPASDWTPLSGMSFTALSISGKVKSLHQLKGIEADTLFILMDRSGWPEGAEKLPEYLPKVYKIWVDRATVPPSACPEFILKFPSLRTITWRMNPAGASAAPTAETLSVDAFRAKYLKKTAAK